MHASVNSTVRPEWLKILWQNDQAISQLDPLGADESIRLLPSLNAKREVDSLLALLGQLLPTTEKALSMNCEEACAAMRDLGLLLGSLKRHGVEPATALPALTTVLPILGSISNYPPRDTLLHYTLWNPSGQRMRTYTGTEDEKNLIRSVQTAMPPLEVALNSLWQLMEEPMNSARALQLSKCISGSLEGLIEGVVHARRSVSTQFFAQELRLYFDPIQLGGESYLGPGAVEMPLFVFDHLFWSSDCEDLTYASFKESYLPYIRPIWRLIYRSYSQQPSLISRLEAALESGNSSLAIRGEALKELISVANRLKSFRMPHRKLAEEAYDHQSGGHRNQGSGGYAPDILSHIIVLMTKKTDVLPSILQSHSISNPTLTTYQE